MKSSTALIFDLDGTLIDSVYQHVIAWRDALASDDMDIPLWRVHRKIGMGSDLFLRQTLREAGRPISRAVLTRLSTRHSKSYKALTAVPKLLPGAKELIEQLRASKIPWAIATSGDKPSALRYLKLLKINTKKDVVVTGEDIHSAKPDPEPFLIAAKRLKVSPERSIVIGDSIWDMLAAARSHALGIGLCSGGFGETELERAGALRVFRDPSDFRNHLEEIVTDVKMV